jgi:hypothetical protein
MSGPKRGARVCRGPGRKLGTQCLFINHWSIHEEVGSAHQLHRISLNSQVYSHTRTPSFPPLLPLQINYDLVEALVGHVVEARQAQQAQRGGAAAILIFAPGAEEINRICRALQSSPRVRAAAGGGSLWVLPLHGGLPPAQQARVFDRPPKGEGPGVCVGRRGGVG